MVVDVRQAAAVVPQAAEGLPLQQVEEAARQAAGEVRPGVQLPKVRPVVPHAEILPGEVRVADHHQEEVQDVNERKQLPADKDL